MEKKTNHKILSENATLINPDGVIKKKGLTVIDLGDSIWVNEAATPKSELEITDAEIVSKAYKSEWKVIL